MDNLTETIKEQIEANYKSVREFAQVVDVPYTTILTALSKGFGGTAVEKVIKICSALNINLMDYSFELTGVHKDNHLTFTSEEMRHIEKYRQIKPHEKEMVDTVLNIAYKEHERLEKIKADRVMEQQASYLCSPAERNYPEGIYQIDDFKNEEEGRISVPVYDFGVSAGTGVFLDNPCYEVISMPEDALSRKANFALWVTGDSMEPRFHDGDLVLVKIQPSVDIGEIGIFVLNGEGYIKKWGGNKLISLNPVYEPIMLTEDDALYCKGKVIGNA